MHEQDKRLSTASSSGRVSKTQLHQEHVDHIFKLCTCRCVFQNKDCTTDLTMEFQDDHVWNLAQRFTEEEQIRTFALRGLKLQEYEIQSALIQKEPNVHLAAHGLLQKWLNRLECRAKAYRSL